MIYHQACDIWVCLYSNKQPRNNGTVTNYSHQPDHVSENRVDPQIQWFLIICVVNLSQSGGEL